MGGGGGVLLFRARREMSDECRDGGDGGGQAAAGWLAAGREGGRERRGGRQQQAVLHPPWRNLCPGEQGAHCPRWSAGLYVCLLPVSVKEHGCGEGEGNGHDSLLSGMGLGWINA